MTDPVSVSLLCPEASELESFDHSQERYFGSSNSSVLSFHCRIVAPHSDYFWENSSTVENSLEKP